MNSVRRTLRVVSLGLLTASSLGVPGERHAHAERAVPETRTSDGTRVPQSASLAHPIGSPLHFEPNRGHADSSPGYLARGKGYQLSLGTHGATLALLRGDFVESGPHASSAARASARTPVIITMHVVGGRNVEPVGEAALASTSHYFVGSDSAKWRPSVENYARVRYEGVLPGVDLVYYGNAERELEYDWRLAPFVSPRSIEVAFDGVESIRIETDGSAVLRLPGGAELRKPAPTAYQTSAGGERVTVACRYQLRGRHLGFVVDGHDPSRALVIDPVLLYSTYLGGSSHDQMFGAATDAAGNTYLVGYTSSTLFPTFDPLQPTLAGGVYDAFVCKLNASGALVYSTFLGGHGSDFGYAIAADAAGNAYVTGVTFSTDFPTRSALQPAPGGKQDAFVAQISPDGSALVYSTYLGGSEDDYAQGIALNAGSAFVVGASFSNNFPKLAPLQATLRGSSDAFLSKLSPSGTSLVYSTYLGGGDMDAAHGVGVDAAGNATVVGTTGSNNFPLVAPLQPSFGGGSYDAFVSKLNAAGSALLYSTYLGGTFNDEAFAVAVQSSGPATVVGATISSNFPVRGAPQPNLASAGESDAFVTRLNAAGTSLIYSTYLGGSGDDSASSVGLDASNSAYVVGSTNSNDFPQNRSITGQSSYHGQSDGFISALDPSGAPFYYSSYLGGSGEDHAVGVAVQPNGLTHVVGNTVSSDFPVLNAVLSNIVGAQDGFVTRLPGIPVAVPANGRSDFWLLASALFGTGLLDAALRRRRARAIFEREHRS